MRDSPNLFSDDSADTVSTVDSTPAGEWDREVAKRSLDELFHLTHQYENTVEFRELVKFVIRFRAYSPFNSMLVHVQMPGAKFVAPPHRWRRDFKRRIKPGARPLVILRPNGPVMFVFDVSDTESMETSKPLPPEIENPFQVGGRLNPRDFEWLIENSKRDGIRVTESDHGSQSAGLIRIRDDLSESQLFKSGVNKSRQPVFVEIPVAYDIVLNRKHSRESKFATIVHELAHLYCGHLGRPTAKHRAWPDRRGCKRAVQEFEAESVAYLVCQRSGINNPSERYLRHHLGGDEKLPSISLDCVLKSSGLIESMTKGRLKPRKE